MRANIDMRSWSTQKKKQKSGSKYIDDAAEEVVSRYVSWHLLRLLFVFVFGCVVIQGL